ncbi:hypothetical protein [Alishewanella maricola]|nr:hypothetical protein [Alishewanella maricola]
MAMKLLFRSLALLILLISFYQLYAVTERVTSALWSLYKFYGSNGEGISIGSSMALITYVVSICLLVALAAIYKKSDDRIALLLSKVSAFTLLFGLVLLTVLLVSPLAHFYPR